MVVNSLEAVTFFFHAYRPFLCVGELHIFNPTGSKFILLQNPHELFSPLLCTMPHICPVAYLLCVELADRHFLSDMVDTVVKVFLDFFLFFPQRYIVALPAGVLSVGLTSKNKQTAVSQRYLYICSISSVFSLALSGSENTIFIIPSFFRHRYAPFHNGKSLDMLDSLYHIQGSISLSDCVHRINHFFKLLTLNLNTVSVHHYPVRGREFLLPVSAACFLRYGNILLLLLW